MNIKTFIDEELIKDQRERSQRNFAIKDYALGKIEGRLAAWELLAKSFEVKTKADFEDYVRETASNYRGEPESFRSRHDDYSQGFFSGREVVFTEIETAINERRFEPTRDEFAQSLGFFDELDLLLYRGI